MDEPRPREFLGANTASGLLLCFDHQHRPASLGHADGCCQPIRPGDDNNHIGFWQARFGGLTGHDL